MVLQSQGIGTLRIGLDFQDALPAEHLAVGHFDGTHQRFHDTVAQIGRWLQNAQRISADAERVAQHRCQTGHQCRCDRSIENR